MISYACFFCKCILIIHLVIARHADQTYGTEIRVSAVLPSFQANRQPCLHLGKLQVQCFLQGHWTMVDWGDLINQWLEQIWWVHLPHMLVAKSFPNPLIDWCWCGSHVVPRSQMIGTPQGLSKSCLSTGCTWHSTCHSAQMFQDRPCHEHTGSWTNHQVLRHVGWLLQGEESFELIKKLIPYKPFSKGLIVSDKLMISSFEILIGLVWCHQSGHGGMPSP